MPDITKADVIANLKNCDLNNEIELFDKVMNKDGYFICLTYRALEKAQQQMDRDLKKAQRNIDDVISGITIVHPAAIIGNSMADNWNKAVNDKYKSCTKGFKQLIPNIYQKDNVGLNCEDLLKCPTEFDISSCSKEQKSQILLNLINGTNSVSKEQRTEMLLDLSGNTLNTSLYDSNNGECLGFSLIGKIVAECNNYVLLYASTLTDEL